MADRIAMATQLARQAAKAGWFFGLHEFTGRMTTLRGQGVAPYKPTRPTPTMRDLIGDIGQLLVEDAKNVGDGVYPPIDEGPRTIMDGIDRLRRMLADVPRAVERRNAQATHAAAGLDVAEDLPDYFVQNFHFQDGGYLTENSARLYDIQVETLFIGAAAAMRRQALRPISEHLAGRDQRQCHLVDAACGTGRFLADVQQAFPALNVTGIDLSPTYIEEARRHLGARRRLNLIEGNAESLPQHPSSQDIVTCIFLFHELPRDVRRTVIAEFARVLKPGGLLVFIDSLQWGDRPGWDGLLEMFPHRFHEPYFADYLNDPLDDAFDAARLAPVATWPAFLSKVMVRKKII